jgi:hypothetical protein
MTKRSRQTILWPKDTDRQYYDQEIKTQTILWPKDKDRQYYDKEIKTDN